MNEQSKQGNDVVGNMESEEMLKNELMEISKKLQEAFEGDETVLRSIAHHYNVAKKQMTEPLDDDTYNLAIPHGEQLDYDNFLEHIRKAKQVLVTCADRRQSYESGEYAKEGINPDELLVLAVAAGAAQPKDVYTHRQTAIVDFLNFVGKVNSEVTFLISDHNNRCGGLAYMENIYEGKGIQPGSLEENEYITSLLLSLREKLSGNVQERTEVVLFHLNGDEFDHAEQISN